MPNFSYEAIDKNGRPTKGTVEAANEQAAYEKLKAQDLVPMTVSSQGFLQKDLDLSFGKKIKPRDLSIFCRQFVSIIAAGVPIVEALEMLADQTENKVLAKAIVNVGADIRKGETLSDAMQKENKVFPPFMISMVSAGEASGSLEISFERLSTHFEKSTKIQAMMKKAMIYPAVVAIVAVIVVIVMLRVVVPGYAEMFESMDAELPAITKFVVAASDFIGTKWLLLIIIVVAAAATIIGFGKTEMGKVTYGTIGCRAPLIGKLTIKTASSLFARTLSTLLAAGMPMLEAMSITADIMSNEIFHRILLSARDEVAQGVPLSEPIRNSKLFPPMVYHMIGIGEETGEVESMLDRMADYYDEEVEMATQSVMAALEPMIILVLAGVVIVIIAAVFAPMLKMYDMIDQM